MVSGPVYLAQLTASLSAPTIGGHALVWNPAGVGGGSSLIKDINRNPTARVPIPPDAQPLRGQKFSQTLRDRDGAIFMKGTVIAERPEIQF